MYNVHGPLDLDPDWDSVQKVHALSHGIPCHNKSIELILNRDYLVSTGCTSMFASAIINKFERKLCLNLQ